MSGISPERQRALLQSAAEWRAYAKTCTNGIGADAALRAAISLEKESLSGVAVCACCQKPFGQDAGIVGRCLK